MKRIIAVFVALAFVAGNSIGVEAVEKYSGGALPVGGVLTKANSPYYITQPIVVLEGETLTIEPGVEVLANPAPVAGVRYLIDLRGSLFVSGSKEQPVTVASVGGEVRLADSYNHNKTTPINVKVTYAKLDRIGLAITKHGQYVFEDSDFETSERIEIAAPGLDQRFSGRSAPVYSNVSFARNSFHNCWLFINGIIRLSKNTFSNNYFTGKDFRMEFFALQPPSNGMNEFIFNGNTFNLVNKKTPSIQARSGDSTTVNLSGSFWAGLNNDDVPSLIFDSQDQRGLTTIVSSPILTSAAVETPKASSREILEKKATFKFKKCADLNKYFPRGITSIPRTSLKATSIEQMAFSFSTGYAANKSLDRDKDKISCEK